MIRGYIIKVDEDKKDIMGDCPLVEKPKELVRCKDCKLRYTLDCVIADFNGDACSPWEQPDDWCCAYGERKDGDEDD